MPYLDVIDPSTRGRKRVLFRYDPVRDLVEVAGANGLIVVDLQRLKDSAKPKVHPMDGREHGMQGDTNTASLLVNSLP